MLYPYLNPVIMDDDIFQKYGGLLADTLTEVRTAAYTIAEQLVSEDLETFLVPTTVTGTYAPTPLLQLDHVRVSALHQARFFNELGTVIWTSTGAPYLRLFLDGSYGVVDLRNGWPCNNYVMSVPMYAQKVEISYTAGLPAEMATAPVLLMALTIVSKIMLNEMVGFGNESSGDVGVVRFSNQGYSEQRVGLLRTVYGTSAQCQMAHKILSPYRLYRQVGL